MCMCSLRYPACNLHAPYCHLWPAWLYNIFPHCLINGKLVEKKFYEHKHVLIFSTFVWSISHSKKWRRHDQKCTLVFKSSTCYSCPILMKLEFSWQIFKKYSSIIFHENSSKELSCSMHTDTTKLTVPFIILRKHLKTQTIVQHIVVNFVNSITPCICAIPVNVPKGVKHVRIMWGCH
jgi:hypothetical protein